MRKFIVSAVLALMGAGTVMYAQENKNDAQPEMNAMQLGRKAQIDSEHDTLRIEEAPSDWTRYREAVEAFQERKFVLEADRVIFRNGLSTFVSSITNFVAMDENRATVQVAFDTSLPGANGLGGVTVEGNGSNFKLRISKRGKVQCSFQVHGVGVAASVSITMSKGSNHASVTVTPNFNNRSLSLSGDVVPLEQSRVFKGLSL